MVKSLISEGDLYHEWLFSMATPYLEQLLGKSILLTGMTGLFGAPVINFLWRYKVLNGDDAPIWVLTRNANKFRINYSKQLESGLFVPIEGDIRSFYFSEVVDYIVHGASVSNEEKFFGVEASERFDVIFSGSRHLLELAVKANAKKILFISSGSVYGGGNNHHAPIKESCISAPDVINDPEACYSEAKRASELQHIIWSYTNDIEVTIARCFSFVGPLFPLDINYSIGNFIRDVLYSDAIRLTGDGTAVRSFMYTYDLAVWLLCLLVEGGNRSAYNVGSEQSVSILELAEIVNKSLNSKLPIKFSERLNNVKGGASGASNWYVPDTNKVSEEYGLKAWTSLEEAIKMTVKYKKCYEFPGTGV